MNDRFKFRVWYMPEYDKPRMIYGAEKTYDFMYGEPEIICADCFGSLLDSKEYILMQSTGLKDKNGKLIYEGDIVKTETQAGKIINYGIIGFDKEKVSFLMTANLQSRDYQYSFWYLDSLEVIGNIYENKELLESEG